MIMGGGGFSRGVLTALEAKTKIMVMKKGGEEKKEERNGEERKSASSPVRAPLLDHAPLLHHAPFLLSCSSPPSCSTSAVSGDHRNVSRGWEGRTRTTSSDVVTAVPVVADWARFHAWNGQEYVGSGDLGGSTLGATYKSQEWLW